MKGIGKEHKGNVRKGKTTTEQRDCDAGHSNQVFGSKQSKEKSIQRTAKGFPSEMKRKSVVLQHLVT